jgi:hypothetical protein
MKHAISEETRRRLALGLVIAPPHRNRRRRSLWSALVNFILNLNL